jgi:thiamine-phosphate pyrophosphorylase
VAALLHEIPLDLRRRIMLHSHHQLAAPLGLRGVHYPERMRPAAPIPQLPSGFRQSTSFHTLEDLEHEDPGFWGPGLEYGFLSPIFDSISKQGDWLLCGWGRTSLQRTAETY